MTKEELKIYHKEYYKNHKEKINAQKRHWELNNKEKRALYRQKNKDRYRSYQLKRKFGITLLDYKKLLRKQNGTCALCAATSSKGGIGVGIGKNSKGIRRLSVDHCHKTGKIRGLLCSNHNRGLGMFSDSIVELLKAIKYLEINR